jgi:hypothetical protein
LILYVISYSFEILGVLVFIETIELNFCGLDKNTRKTIQKREREDMNLENLERNNSLNNNLVEISPGYMVSKEYDILNDSTSITKKLQKNNNMRIMKDMD